MCWFARLEVATYFMPSPRSQTLFTYVLNRSFRQRRGTRNLGWTEIPQVWPSGRKVTTVVHYLSPVNNCAYYIFLEPVFRNGEYRGGLVVVQQAGKDSLSLSMYIGSYHTGSGAFEKKRETLHHLIFPPWSGSERCYGPKVITRPVIINVIKWKKKKWASARAFFTQLC